MGIRGALEQFKEIKLITIKQAKKFLTRGKDGRVLEWVEDSLKPNSWRRCA